MLGPIVVVVVFFAWCLMTFHDPSADDPRWSTPSGDASDDASSAPASDSTYPARDIGSDWTDEELWAFLDHDLDPERHQALDAASRADSKLRARLSAIEDRWNSGYHSVGSIWRRFSLSCPTREELADHLQDLLPDDHAAYVRFHLEQVACAPCNANVQDLTRSE